MGSNQELEEPAAHRCLWINEIILPIARIVHDSGKGKSGVASLALTCKTFADPANEVLWENMSSLLPLVKLAPPETWEIVPDERSSLPTFQWIGQPILDTARLLQYARRVKAFEWLSNRELSLLSLLRLLQQFQLTTEDKCLFPNLRSLRWTEKNPWMYHLITKFPGVHLKQLRATEHDGENWCAVDVLLMLQSRLQQLEEFKFSTPLKFWSPALAQFSRVISNPLMGNLSKFSCISNPLTAAQVGALACMPRLKVAEFLVDDEPMNRLQPGLVRAGFLNLEALRLFSRGLNALTFAVFMGIQSRSLQTIALGIYTNPLESVVRAHFEILSSPQFALSLKTLVIWLGTGQDILGHSTASAYAITPDTIHPLLQLHQLRKIDVQSNHIALPMSFLPELAQAFPYAEYFSMVSLSTCEDTVTVPLFTVMHFVARFSHLRYLGLNIDADIDARMTLLPVFLPPLTPSASLLHLNVGTGCILRPWIIYKHLRTIFPSLKRLTHTDYRKVVGVWGLSAGMVKAAWDRVGVWNTLSLCNPQALHY